jgi:hypothetical protein
MTRFCKVPILFAIVLSGCRTGAANTNRAQAASILFDQFETVFYAKADLLASSGGYKQFSAQSANTLRAAFADLLGGLHPLGKQASVEIFDNADAVLVGSKDFRPPAGLGGVHSQFCYVVVLRNRSDFDIGRFASKSSLISSAGGSVWKWVTKPTEGQQGPQTFFAAQSGHSYLLISNNVEGLQAMTVKLASPSLAASMPRGVPNWESLSQHDVWGYRRYRQTEISYRDAAGMTDVTPTAEALYFFVDSEKKVGVLRLLASDYSTAKRMNARAKLPSLEPVGSGAWETNIPLMGTEASSEQMLATMWLFGRGLYL